MVVGKACVGRSVVTSQCSSSDVVHLTNLAFPAIPTLTKTIASKIDVTCELWRYLWRVLIRVPTGSGVHHMTQRHAARHGRQIILPYDRRFPSLS